MRYLFLILLLTVSAYAQSPSPSPELVEEPAEQMVAPLASPSLVLPPDAAPEASPQVEATPVVTPTAAATPTPSQTAVSSYRYRSTVTHRELFLVANSGNYTAEERAHLIARRVEGVLEAITDDTLPPVVTETRQYDTVLKLGDKLLATILPGDVQAQFPDAQVTKALLAQTAEIWRSQLETDLEEGHSFGSPTYFWTTLGSLLLILCLFLWIHFRLSSSVAQKTSVPVGLLRACMWTFYGVMCLWSYPPSRRWAVALYQTAFRPVLWGVSVIFMASLIIHVFEYLVLSYFRSLLDDGERPTSRRFRRLSTLQQVALVTGRVILVLIAFFIFLAALPINYAPLLASASVLGVAFGFAAQDTLRDVFAGISILAEDRYGVGDWIEWQTHSGSVESFNLKTTRLRTTDGSVLILSNADLRVVRNLSNEWSQVDFRIGVAYENDFRHALACLKEEADRLAEEWEGRIIAPPEVKGVESLGDSSVSLRIFLKTQPLAQWDVQREMNARVKERFDREGISIPYPQRTVWVHGDSSDKEQE